jgi:diamine N-acetyltransferase
MPVIELRAITLENWKECVSLSLKPDQREFLPDNVYSIAESQFYPDCSPLAI